MAEDVVAAVAALLKVCTACAVAQPEDQFFRDKRYPGRLRPTCKTCGAESYRAWREGRLQALNEQRALTRKRLKKSTFSEEQANGRVCSCCNERKLLTAFYANVNYHNGHTKFCKACQLAKRKASRYAEPAKHRTLGRQRHLKKSYGLTEEAVTELLKAQDMKCAICTRHLAGATSAYAGPYVDHDHQNGKVRGILCFACNSGLGRFCDNIDTLLRAVAYLRKAASHGESG